MTPEEETLPRYFVPRTATDAAAVPPEPVAAVHVVDCFSLGQAGQPDREWLVVTDGLGNLLALPGSERGSLPASVQAELAAHEVCGPRCFRRIEAAQLFLFNLQLLEQPTQAPG
jgi:hypothetical protein